MSETLKTLCPECGELPDESQAVDRRNFIRVVSGTAATVLTAGAVAGTGPQLLAQAAQQPAQPAARQAKPAEGMIQELFTSMTADQRRTLVLPWDHGSNGGEAPTRKRMYNSALNGQMIGDLYNPQQQELIERILRAISSGDDGMRQLTRGGTYDGSRSLQRCGAHIFGDVGNGRQYSWVFTGHHLTVRCDGNSEPDAAFGGPMYYGHSPDGYSQRNIFFYQTRSVLAVFDALTEAQRRRAVVTGSPGEQMRSVQFRREHPGIPSADLTADQRRLVETVMREILSPYRREDADEVMELVRRNGGLERIHLAFYRDREANDANRWHFWRLEGPGFVWNYRVLPHVHCYVNIGAAPRA